MKSPFWPRNHRIFYARSIFPVLQAQIRRELKILSQKKYLPSIFDEQLVYEGHNNKEWNSESG